MQSAVPVGQGKMLAVLGVQITEIKDLIEKLKFKKGICEIANDNAEGQVILSGDKEGITSLQTLLKQNKIKSIPLKVSAPFHCSLMKPAAVSMTEKINKIQFDNPVYEIINNVTAKPEKNSDIIKKLLIDQIFLQ